VADRRAGGGASPYAGAHLLVIMRCVFGVREGERVGELERPYRA